MKSRQATVLEVDKVLVVAQRRCKDLGISVRFDINAETAYTDGRNITFPEIGHPITKQSLDVLYGEVIHECGHHLRPQAFSILKAAMPPEHLCALYNIVEDDGMERERATEWLGDAKALSIMNSIILGRVRESWVKNLGGVMPPGQDPAPLAAMTIGQLSRLAWDEYSPPVLSGAINALPEEVRTLVTELENEGWVRKFQSTSNATETWDVAVDLAKRLYPNNDQDEYEKIREAGKAGASHPNGTPRDDSSSSFKDAQGKQARSNAKNVDTESESGQSAQDNADGSVISWKDCVLSTHSEWSEDHVGGSLGITWEDRQFAGKVGIMPHNKVNVITDFVKERNDRYTSNDYKAFMPSDAHSRAFANRIRRYIQAQARSTVDREKYHGKLDKQAVVRLLMPPIDGGEWNKKIFYDQRKHTVKDTAIFVLVDWSGSMRGPKQQYAADAAQRLVHTFERVLNIPVGLAAFSNRKTLCDVGYIKPWNTRGLTAEKIARRFAMFRNYTSGNDDADAVNWAWHQILPRKETRKILIVLSDGAPAGSWNGHPDDALKCVTSAIEKDGRVELYGVGIKSEAVKKYYTNHTHLSDPKQINETLFNLIKEGNNVK